MDLHRELRCHVRAVAEQLLQNVRYVRDEIDRVVPHDHNPRAIALGRLFIDRLVDSRGHWSGHIGFSLPVPLFERTFIGMARIRLEAVSVGTMSTVAHDAPSTSRAEVKTSRLAAYIALTKPRIIELLLVTTVPTMVVAKRGLPSLWLMTATVIGGALAAGGANAVNMWWDRDIDAVMKRTSRRPLVTGAITPNAAITFACLLVAASFVWLTVFVNLLSAMLALSAALFYVLVYTVWLKRNYTSNIVIGGAAGAVPVLVGWAAVTNRVDLPPLVMFAIIFVWTPPHFWALAFRYREDYRRAHVPMLPAVNTLAYTAKHILAYTLLLWALSLVLVPIAQLGAVYWVVAVTSGAVFTAFALRLLRDHNEKTAMALFHYSITYLTLLFAAMAVDQLVSLGS